MGISKVSFFSAVDTPAVIIGMVKADRQRMFAVLSNR